MSRGDRACREIGYMFSGERTYAEAERGGPGWSGAESLNEPNLEAATTSTVPAFYNMIHLKSHNYHSMLDLHNIAFNSSRLSEYSTPGRAGNGQYPGVDLAALLAYRQHANARGLYDKLFFSQIHSLDVICRCHNPSRCSLFGSPGEICEET